VTAFIVPAPPAPLQLQLAAKNKTTTMMSKIAPPQNSGMATTAKPTAQLVALMAPTTWTMAGATTATTAAKFAAIILVSVRFAPTSAT